MSKNKKIAVISGATGGMGAEIARKLASDGFDLVLLGRNHNKLNEIAATIKTTFNSEVTSYCFDVRDNGAVTDFVNTLKKKYNYVNTLVYAAGDGPVAKLSDTNDDEWLNTFDVKLMGEVRLTRSMEDLLENGKGSVVIN
jgi:NADP-dependent 3-hydroxy acid dehydrogenase YdfG